ncbi:zinc-binding dehydrogenase [Sorangium sp. So ce124]
MRSVVPRGQESMQKLSDQLSTSRSRAVRLDSFGGDRVRALAPRGITAAIDLHGTETAHAARALGVPDTRITTIAAQVDGITPTNGANAAPGALEKLARLIATGRLRVPIAASFPVEQIRAAVELQAGRHVKGKVVIDL